MCHRHEICHVVVGKKKNKKSVPEQNWQTKKHRQTHSNTQASTRRRTNENRGHFSHFTDVPRLMPSPQSSPCCRCRCDDDRETGCGSHDRGSDPGFRSSDRCSGNPGSPDRPSGYCSDFGFGFGCDSKDDAAAAAAAGRSSTIQSRSPKWRSRPNYRRNGIGGSDDGSCYGADPDCDCDCGCGCGCDDDGSSLIGPGCVLPDDFSTMKQKMMARLMAVWTLSVA